MKRAWLAALRDTMPTCAPGECAACGHLPLRVSANVREGEESPSIGRLIRIVKLLDGVISACAKCGALFRSEGTYDLEGAHLNTATLSVTRITGAEAVLLVESPVHGVSWREFRATWKEAHLPRIAGHANEAAIVAARKPVAQAPRPPAPAPSAPDPNALLESLLGAKASPEQRLECTKALGVAGTGRWTKLRVDDHPMLGKKGVRIASREAEDVHCAACDCADTLLVGYADYDYRDPSYDYYHRVASLECRGCSRFSLYVQWSESRS